MKLFLASEAKNPQSLPKLEEIIGGFTGKSLAYIPTALNGEKFGAWKESESWDIIQNLGADVISVQLEDYIDRDVLTDLVGKDIIWFAGGQPGYLMYWIRRLQLDTQIKSILDQGTLYVGSSAGSMITGKSLDITEWYIGENEHGANVIPGLGLVDFDIYPHFREEHFEEINQYYKGEKLYLLKDGEEVIYNDGEIIVVGEERVINKK